MPDLPRAVDRCCGLTGAKIMAEPLNPGDDAAPGTPGTGEDVCPRCGGKGTIEGGECRNCGGTGKVIEGIGGG